MKINKVVFLFVAICSFVLKSCNSTTEKNNSNLNGETNTLELKQAQQDLINESKKRFNTPEERLEYIRKLDSANLHKLAIEQIDLLIIQDSANQDYWLIKGRQLCKNFDSVAAIKSFVTATKIYPSPIAMLELANIFAETKNINTIKVCEDLKKMNPDGKQDAAANYFIGKYYSNINNLKKAYLYLDSSINQDFHLTDAFIEKGYLLFSENKIKDALKVFELLNTLNTKNADGYYWQAKCHKALNNKQKAVEFYKKSLQLDNSITEARQAIKELEN